MRWPWRRRPGPEPAAPADDDQVAQRLRELAARWQQDPGVRRWADDNPPAGEALAGPTMMLPTAGPLLTPGQAWRARGSQS